jgi:hypothetical protein
LTVRAASLATVALAAAALAPTVAAAEPFTLEAGGSKSGRGKVRAIGDFHPERIGDPQRRLRRLYPGATRHGRSWWLAKGINVFGTGNPYPVLRATMSDRRVRSLALQIGAAGD